MYNSTKRVNDFSWGKVMTYIHLAVLNYHNLWVDRHLGVVFRQETVFQVLR